MSEKKKIEFKCWACGSNKLAYQKYAKCLTPVRATDDGDFLYFDILVEEDECLAVLNGFCCQDCGSFLEYSGCRVETEKQLQCYLENAPDKPDEEQGVPVGETSPKSELNRDKDADDFMNQTEIDGVDLSFLSRDLKG